MNSSCELQKLYESGIQFTVQPYPGRGFIVGHGDYLRKAGNLAVVPTFEAAVAWLCEQVKAYPDRRT
jgi:hypothetical protein